MTYHGSFAKFLCSEECDDSGRSDGSESRDGAGAIIIVLGVGPFHVVASVLGAISVRELPPDEGGTADLDFLITGVRPLQVDGLCLRGGSVDRVVEIDVPNLAIKSSVSTGELVIRDGPELLA